MTTYRVEMMRNEDYANYMAGGMLYQVERVFVEANSKEEAIWKAEKDGYTVNPNPKTFQELEAEKEENEKAIAKIKATDEEKKAKRAANEVKKAREAGLTVEEYRKEKTRLAKIRKIKREITELEKELENKKNYLKRLI